MQQRQVPFHKYSFNHLEESAMIETLRSGWITRGPKVAEFETAFADYTSAKHALALNSCTAGLHLALIALNLQPGDEVITTPLTFVATVNMIVRSGATPVLADIDPATLNISVKEIEKKISAKTKAIIPVHLAGQPCDMQPILELARSKEIIVIEDAAHATGTEYHGQRIGAISDMSVFSFYANKNITTGEGGMLTTNHPEWDERLRPLSLHGLSKDAWKRFSEGGFKTYLVEEPGFKYNMTDIQAALGLVQLGKSEDFLEKRAQCAHFYRKELQELPVHIPTEIPNIRHSHHLFMLQLNEQKLSISRDQLIDQLHQRGIGSAVHYFPIHFHPFYQRLMPQAMQELPYATRAGQNLISLPIYPDLSQEDQNYVIQCVKEILNK
ncbi:UDP-4-amino-4,6-dideoxy-N-acetyl-beta-L-altrosamine transaminase [bacterium (Candidatus Blackallbacteria) CG17_big_fil_post_rev_8_21_14_2_50_48_46]|uniref:UDP-4-amino-4, 6-dideoxy-N-acetyl-beta-L-altrosamine transaminase n=1 Tax=bacterium (Candidatus Blackallbacteria) CG17_big_fil_post_rev_8_21_14_2_50_48_46 TaxID=2014261 RepID=A0A2M7GB50_9BACT|nr:MAG: UDP-4-amino-4,6-dideoxy-N-acetyl-beta-L-altrosamine transaminase [bacterium (Candidatus Blackallbacteria) CG18_big_fil_WC_8_21_14_2_50_49_26]PIW19388.1 MAG: UDP-4-amino-4,6-dideoxy-N-acetyl-beta-L-altrosamine transaminase [bacterium (Candidatus Blackallbacteria) CG17_big_fil_post_rev_8_21_14_2_50_48_46]PIW49008.1 MAG: UDP-4-amino-4,6-dideoxy-N-acetyl-beta-L-altrosamine transaminase [bacterium (Candidatus Blackallbacteria) CG13_big_fil_rev_8_21_14_2_50_49_14]